MGRKVSEALFQYIHCYFDALSFNIWAGGEEVQSITKHKRHWGVVFGFFNEGMISFHTDQCGKPFKKSVV